MLRAGLSSSHDCVRGRDVVPAVRAAGSGSATGCWMTSESSSGTAKVTLFFRAPPRRWGLERDDAAGVEGGLAFSDASRALSTAPRFVASTTAGAFALEPSANGAVRGLPLMRFFRMPAGAAEPPLAHVGQGPWFSVPRDDSAAATASAAAVCALRVAVFSLRRDAWSSSTDD